MAKEKKIVFITNRKGRYYVKYDDDSIGEELFNEGIIDEAAPHGKFVKCESWIEIDEIESLGYTVKEE